MAGIAEVLGATGEENVQGEAVKVLDVLSNTIMNRRLLTSGLVCMIVSEEDDQPQLPHERYAGGKYVVAVDPCDGSSNIGNPPSCLMNFRSLFLPLWSGRLTRLSL